MVEEMCGCRRTFRPRTVPN